MLRTRGSRGFALDWPGRSRAGALGGLQPVGIMDQLGGFAGQQRSGDSSGLIRRFVGRDRRWSASPESGPHQLVALVREGRPTRPKGPWVGLQLRWGFVD